MMEFGACCNTLPITWITFNPDKLCRKYTQSTKSRNVSERLLSSSDSSDFRSFVETAATLCASLCHLTQILWFSFPSIRPILYQQYSSRTNQRSKHPNRMIRNDQIFAGHIDSGMNFAKRIESITDKSWITPIARRLTKKVCYRYTQITIYYHLLNPLEQSEKYL